MSFYTLLIASLSSPAGGAAPVNVTAPQIVSSMVVGVPMSVVPGTYTGTVTGRTYQWKKAGVAISGATSTTYSAVSGDAQGAITVDEVASNSGTAAAAATSASVICAPASAAYATALAAVTDGQYFTAPSTDANRLRIYQRVSGEGVLFGRTPAQAAVNAAAAAIRAAAGPASTPLMDFDSTDVYYGERQYQNRVAGAPTRTLNLLGHYSHAKTGYTAQGTPTIIGRVADSQGGTLATQIQIASGAAAITTMYISARIPPGRWILAFDAIAITTGAGAATQSIKFSYNGTTSLQVANLTTSWQTFSQSFNNATEAVFNALFTHGEYDGTTAPAVARDFAISNLRLIPGSSVVGNADTYPHPAALSTTEVGLASNGFELECLTNGANGGNVLGVKIAALSTLTNWSYATTLSGLTGSAFPTLLGMIRDVGTNIYVSENNAAVNNGQTSPNIVIVSSLMNGQTWIGLGRVVFGLTVTSTTVAVYINGILISTYATGTAPPSVANFALLSLHGGISGLGTFLGEVSGAMFWRSTLTDTQMADASAVLSSRAAAKGLAIAPLNDVHIGEGDSRTVSIGDTGPGFAVRAMANAGGTRILTDNRAASGTNLSQIAGSIGSPSARMIATLARITALRATGQNVILTLQTQINDDTFLHDQASCDSYYATMKWAYAQYRAAGAKVIACTDTPDGSDAAYDSTSLTTTATATATAAGIAAGTVYTGPRFYLNALVLSDPTQYDGCADTANATNLAGTWATANTNGAMADTKHPNALGHSAMANKVIPFVQSLRVGA